MFNYSYSASNSLLEVLMSTGVQMFAYFRLFCLIILYFASSTFPLSLSPGDSGRFMHFLIR